MTGDQALSFVHGCEKFGSRLGLDSIKMLMDRMDNPQDRLKCIHIAGTNGKGSTAAYLSKIMQLAGLKTGLYTSPALERFSQRIVINEKEIEMDDLAAITEKVKSCVDSMVRDGHEHPTEFEIVTAIAFQYYLDNKCDAVVLETGLGGRFDATNVIKEPMISVITTINYDHMDRLGNTLAEIAYEKAGIIKKGCSVVLYPQSAEAEKVFEDVCRERGAVLHKVDFNDLRIIKNDISGSEFSYKAALYKAGLLGAHQAKNAAVAIETALVLSEDGIINLTMENITKGISCARWLGRLEVIRNKPLFLIDGAHNPECAKALSEALKEIFPGRRIIFIMGVLKDKEYRSIIEAMLPLAERFFTITPDSARALPQRELSEVIKEMKGNAENGGELSEAVCKAMCKAGENGIVCAFGSLYFIGEVRKLLLTGGELGC